MAFESRRRIKAGAQIKGVLILNTSESLKHNANGIMRHVSLPVVVLAPVFSGSFGSSRQQEIPGQDSASNSQQARAGKLNIWQRILLALRERIDRVLPVESGITGKDGSTGANTEDYLAVRAAEDALGAAAMQESAQKALAFITQSMKAASEITQEDFEHNLQKMIGSRISVKVGWADIPHQEQAIMDRGSVNRDSASNVVEPEPAESQHEVAEAVELDLPGVIRKILQDDPKILYAERRFYHQIASLCEENNIILFKYQYLDSILDAKKSVGIYIYKGLNKDNTPNVVMDNLRKACPNLAKEKLMEFQALICEALEWQVDLEAVYYMGTHGGNVAGMGKTKESAYPVLDVMQSEVGDKILEDDYVQEIYVIKKNIEECEARRRSGRMGIVEFKDAISRIWEAANSILQGKAGNKQEHSGNTLYKEGQKKPKLMFSDVVKKYYLANPKWLCKENWQQFDGMLTRYAFDDAFYKKAYPAFSMALKAGWGNRFLQEQKRQEELLENHQPADVDAKNDLCAVFFLKLGKSRSGRNCAQWVVCMFTYLFDWQDCKDKFTIPEHG